MADVGEVNAVNRALFLLGQDPVDDLSDASLQFSAGAVKLLGALGDARDLTLARHGWACALEYVTLQPATIPGYVNWRYPTVFLLPPDALRVWEIGGTVANGNEYQSWLPRWQIGTTEVENEDFPRLIIRASADSGGYYLLDGSYWGWSSAPSSASSAAPASPDGNPATPPLLGPLNVAYVRRCAWLAMDPHVYEAAYVRLAAIGCYSVTGDQALARKLELQAEQKAIDATRMEGNAEGGQPPAAPSMPHLLRMRSR
jgi:hypothetical protein